MLKDLDDNPVHRTKLGIELNSYRHPADRTTQRTKEHIMGGQAEPTVKVEATEKTETVTVQDEGTLKVEDTPDEDGE